MSANIVRCGDKQWLVAYLYGEASQQERAAAEAHLALCRGCADELTGLTEVRETLQDWRAPDLGLDVDVAPFRREQPWWRAPLPLWAQAAAAVLVLSAGVGLANLEIRYDAAGFTVRTGWHRPDAASASRKTVGVQTTSSAAETDGAWRTALAETEQRLRVEFAVPARSHAPAAARVAPSDDLMRQVRALIGESEQRQQRELALRLTQVVRDFETQRRADLVRIEQNMGQIEGLTGAEAAHQRELLNYLVRVSQRR